MKKYDSYKDSGIEWIGEIPSHWETKRIRHIADIFGRIGYRGYTVEDIVFDETGAILLSPSNIENQKLTLESVTRITEEKYEESPEIMVYENDVVLVKTASVGKAAIVRPLNDLATINPQLVVFKNYRIDQTFFYYEIISRIIQDQITQDLNGGVVNTITQTNLNNYSIIAPPPEEQTAIAAYLDRKTAEIDELIADKKRLLELYEEEKTAIINQAVTKGINSDAPMKDSGIEWLGEIPEHWEVKRFKYYFKLITEKVDDDLPKIGLENIESKSGKFIETDSDFAGQGVRFRPKDILFGKLRPYLAKVWLSDFDGQAVGDFYVFRSKQEVSPDFAKYRILDSSFIEVTNSSTYGSKMPRVSWEFIADLPIAFPKLHEQQSLIRHIETECARIDAIKTKTEKLIELLTEYRTALISEVVTGKIKVTE
ncbi:hypothetical protein MASR1M45_12430 [Candidatus Kapaibacterium sp.]